MLVKFNIFPTRCSSLLTLIQETLDKGSPDTSQLRLYGRPSITVFEKITTLSTDEGSVIKLINDFNIHFLQFSVTFSIYIEKLRLRLTTTLNLLSGKLTHKFKYYLKH